MTNSTINLPNGVYSVIAKKLLNLTAHVKVVSTSLNDINSASNRLETLEAILKQYEPNNYEHET